MSSLVGRARLYLGHAEGRLVNRLDRETSGVVLIARHVDAASELGKLVASGAVQKQYWAIVHGHVAETEFTIDAPLGKDERSIVAIKDCVRDDGAKAKTRVTVRSRFTRDGSAFTWLDVAPESGRKHQIRIHLAHIGHSIVGDKIYGSDDQIYLRFIDGTLTPQDEAVLMVPNHLLHARAVSFSWRGRLCAFEADPDAGFLPFLAETNP